MELRANAPVTGAGEIGCDDYIKVESGWERILRIDKRGHSSRALHLWTFYTEDGNSYEPWEVLRYAKAQDLTD